MVETLTLSPLPPTHNVLPVSQPAIEEGYRRVLDMYRQPRLASLHDPRSLVEYPNDRFISRSPDPASRTLGRYRELSEIIGRTIRIDADTSIRFDARHHYLYGGGLDLTFAILDAQAARQRPAQSLQQPTQEACMLFGQSTIMDEDLPFPSELAESFVDFLTAQENALPPQAYDSVQFRNRLEIIDRRRRVAFEKAQPGLSAFIAERAQRFERLARRITKTRTNEQTAQDEEFEEIITPGAAEAFTLGCIDAYFLYQAMVRTEETGSIFAELREKTSQLPPSDVLPAKAEALNILLFSDFETLTQYKNNMEDRFILQKNPSHELILLSTETMTYPDSIMYDATGTHALVPDGIEEPFLLIVEKDFHQVYHYDETPLGELDNVFYDREGRLCETSIVYIIDQNRQARKMTIVRHLLPIDTVNLTDPSIALDDTLAFHEYHPIVSLNLQQVMQSFPDAVTSVTENLMEVDYSHLVSIIRDFQNGKYRPKPHGFGEEE